MGAEVAELRSARGDSVAEGKSKTEAQHNTLTNCIIVALLEKEKREMEQTFMKELKDLQDQTTTVYDKEIDRLKEQAAKQQKEIEQLVARIRKLETEAAKVQKPGRQQRQSLQRVSSRMDPSPFWSLSFPVQPHNPNNQQQKILSRSLPSQ